ncbi:Cerato-platanin [Scleroderma yunnanense]
MKFTTIIGTLAAFLVPQVALAQSTVKVTYDYNYMNATFPLNSTACSNGVNGLVTRGYPTLGSLPSFPNVGGIPGLTWNSTLCGTCWTLSYTFTNGTTTEVTITAVDAASTFNLSPQAFGHLGGSVGYEAGSVEAIATQVAVSECGL